MAAHLRQQNVFHRQCTRLILGVSRERQWEERLTSHHLAKVTAYRCVVNCSETSNALVGHIMRMGAGRTLRKVLFGELPASRPRFGSKKR